MTGVVVFPFQAISQKAPFDDERKRRQLREHLHAISGVDTASDALNSKPRTSIDAFADEAALAGLFEALKWFIDEALEADGIV